VTAFFSYAGIAGVFVGALFLGLSHTGAWDPSLLRPVAEQGVERDSIEWEVHRLSKERFAISLPRGWQTATRNPAGREELARLRKENPKLAGFFADAVVFRNPAVRFRAFDARQEVRAAATKELFVSGMNVVRGPAAASRAGTWKRTAQGVRSIPSRVGPVRQMRRMTKSGKALELHYKVRVRRSSAPEIVLSFRQYSVVAGPKEYVLTFVTTKRQARSYAPTFRKSASSFRLL
jgi:hypothetical protein